ncbi:MAG: hypothetical protein ABIH52_02885 [Candidatus Aenigmatarchaeota archaeon]
MVTRKASFGIATILAIVVVLSFAIAIVSMTAHDVEAGRVKACNDGIDNDGDGYTDYPADPGCSKKTDNTETNPNVQCDDGNDNDGDSLVDMQDPGCTSPTDNDEYNAPPIYCGDGTCNGDETCGTCEEDCGVCDSCADMDGYDIETQGTVSGYDDNVPFSYTDYCDGDYSVIEYYCIGTGSYSDYASCFMNTTNGSVWGNCIDGACVF